MLLLLCYTTSSLIFFDTWRENDPSEFLSLHCRRFMCDKWTRGAPLCFSVSISFDWHHDVKGKWGSALQEVIYGDSKECCWSRLDVQEREASGRNELGFHKKWNYSSWLFLLPCDAALGQELPFIFCVLSIKCSAPRTNANLRDTWKLKSV